MHRELRNADIRSEDTCLPDADRAERSAAAHIRAVIENLQGRARAREYRFDHGGGERVRGVCAARVRFQRNALAEIRAVGGVELGGIVGVKSLRVIDGNAEGGCERGVVIRLRQRLRLRNAREYGAQEISARALPRAAPDLLRVKAGGDANAVAGRFRERVQGGVRARQIVQPRRGEELSVRAPEIGFFRAGGVQIVRDGTAEQIVKILLPEREQGQVFLQVGREFFVHVAVEVNGERGERNEKIARERKGAERAVFLAHDAPRKAERAVEKGMPDAAAVRFGVEPRAVTVRKGGVLFEFQTGRIEVARRNLESLFRVSAYERDDRAAAAHDEVFALRLQVPRRAFVKLAESVRLQQRARVFRGLVRRV